MKHVEHLLIGISSGVLLYLSNLSISFNTIIFLLGITIGSVFPDIDGNTPRKYKQNQLLFWSANINYFIIYPIYKFLYRKRDLKIRDISNFFAIIIIALLFYLIIGIINLFIRLPFSNDFLITGILLGGFFNIIAHFSTPEGIKPFYPFWNLKISGKISTLKSYEKRQYWLVILPMAIICIELLYHFSIIWQWCSPTDFNLFALVLIWGAYFYSAGVLTSINISSKFIPSISQQRKSTTPKSSPQSAHFQSDVEKYNFEELNNERQKHGLNQLIFDNSYADLSRNHSRTMSNSAKIFHGDNVNRTHGSFSGENCALMFRGRIRGFKHEIKTERDVARALHRQWMNSSGHRENILNSGYNYVGIGVHTKGHSYYATQLFSN